MKEKLNPTENQFFRDQHPLMIFNILMILLSGNLDEQLMRLFDCLFKTDLKRTN